MACAFKDLQLLANIAGVGTGTDITAWSVANSHGAGVITLRNNHAWELSLRIGVLSFSGGATGLGVYHIVTHPANVQLRPNGRIIVVPINGLQSFSVNEASRIIISVTGGDIDVKARCTFGAGVHNLFFLGTAFSIKDLGPI